MSRSNPPHNPPFNMHSYEKLLSAVIRYLDKNGATQDTLDKVETMLPGAWSAELIADALDTIAAR